MQISVWKRCGETQLCRRWVWSRHVIYCPLFTTGKRVILEAIFKLIIHCNKLMLTSMMWRSTASKVMKLERWETRLCYKMSIVEIAPPLLKPCWIKDTMNTLEPSKDNREESQAPRCVISTGNWGAQHMSQWSRGVWLLFELSPKQHSSTPPTHFWGTVCTVFWLTLEAGYICLGSTHLALTTIDHFRQPFLLWLLLEYIILVILVRGISPRHKEHFGQSSWIKLLKMIGLQYDPILQIVLSQETQISFKDVWTLYRLYR